MSVFSFPRLLFLIAKLQPVKRSTLKDDPIGTDKTSPIAVNTERQLEDIITSPWTTNSRAHTGARQETRQPE
ncbi:hypothetical protein PM082_012384 [Marasmius tenuissimus]|nr:hypothetical protein PM082_012384 [Marasmius tenuissimus]